MKKLIILFILLTNISHSQIRIGYSLLEIVNEFNIKDLTLNKEANYISLNTNTAYIFYNLDSNDICISVAICPKTNDYLLEYIQYYENTYKRYSKSTWIEETIYTTPTYISLNKTNKGRYFFYWYKNK